MRILVVEDDRKVASFIKKGLEEEGHAVDVAADGAEAIDRATDGTVWDLLVLDVMLPKRDGFSVLKSLREDGVKAPVLMLTARDAVGDRVTGLDLGADDYLTKPFAFEELLARVRALLRRGAGGGPGPVLRVGDLTLNPATREVRRGARRIELTAREYTLLEYFMRSPGRVLSRPLLAQHVWGLDFDSESNVVDVYVGYLRRRIEAAGERKLLHTVRGVGYVLKDEP
ncbi:MAG TPA: response regulator transcription factor [Candidatus Bathyarchaeia archaeon]|nr:response regulator transcription factor [Candidatus Bathyarchaeia archaeon]